MAPSRTEILGLSSIRASLANNVSSANTGWSSYHMRDMVLKPGTSNVARWHEKGPWSQNEMACDENMSVFRMEPIRLDDGRYYRACMVRHGPALSTPDNLSSHGEATPLEDTLSGLVLGTNEPDEAYQSGHPVQSAAGVTRGTVTPLSSRNPQMPRTLWRNVEITLLTSAEPDSEVVLAQTYPGARLLQFGGYDRESALDGRWWTGKAESVAGIITAWYTDKSSQEMGPVCQTILHGAYHNVNEARCAKIIPIHDFSAKSPGFHAIDETNERGFTVVPMGTVRFDNDYPNCWTLVELENQAAHDKRVAERSKDAAKSAILPPDW